MKAERRPVTTCLGGGAVGEARVPAPGHALRRRQLARPLALEEEDGLGERVPVVVRGGAVVPAGGNGVAWQAEGGREEDEGDREAAETSHGPAGHWTSSPRSPTGRTLERRRSLSLALPASSLGTSGHSGAAFKGARLFFAVYFIVVSFFRF
jgi:hypothetical protein